MTFTMWSPLHFLFIASPFLVAGILHFLTRGLDPERKRKIGFWLSVACVGILFLRNAEILVKNHGVADAEIVPLQICHFANFVLLAAFWKNSKVWFALAFCLNLPSAILSIVFANSLENYSTILTFRGMAYLFGHLLIVATTLWAFLNGFVRISKTVFFRTLGLMLSLYAGGLIVDNLFNHWFGWSANYFYALEPESGTPLELFFEWGETLHLGWFEVNPLYLLLTMVTGLVVVGAFYGIYRLAEPALSKRFGS